MITAICPGSFDPITVGHLDIIRRAAKLFDHVVVCVMVNFSKPAGMFTAQERVEMAKLAVADLPNVTVDSWNGLLTAYAAGFEQPVIVKGLRASSDYEYEFLMNNVNKKLYPELETIFLTADSQYTFLSSSVVRELATYNADLTGLVPEVLIDMIQNKSEQWRQNHGRL